MDLLFIILGVIAIIVLHYLISIDNIIPVILGYIGIGTFLTYAFLNPDCSYWVVRLFNKTCP